MFYVTGTTKQELFNTAEKTKESSVDDVNSSCDLKTLSISPPDTSPDSFHEVPVDCPEEVPVDVPQDKIHGKPVCIRSLQLCNTYKKQQGISNKLTNFVRVTCYTSCCYTVSENIRKHFQLIYFINAGKLAEKKLCYPMSCVIPLSVQGYMYFVQMKGTYVAAQVAAIVTKCTA